MPVWLMAPANRLRGWKAGHANGAVFTRKPGIAVHWSAGGRGYRRGSLLRAGPEPGLGARQVLRPRVEHRATASSDSMMTAGTASDANALVRIYNAFRDESGRPNPAFDVRANEITIVAEILRQGQETGCLGSFDPRIMAAVMKAALDDLLVQYADNPELDLEAYGAELVALFQGATRPDHGPTTSSAPAGQQATAPRPVDLVTPEEEK